MKNILTMDAIPERFFSRRDVFDWKSCRGMSIKRPSVRLVDEED
jgi:hypothetical protein